MTDEIRGAVTKIIDSYIFEMKVAYQDSRNKNRYNAEERIRIERIDILEYGLLKCRMLKRLRKKIRKKDCCLSNIDKRRLWQTCCKIKVLS